MENVNYLMLDFVWKGKDKINRLALIADYKDSGLKMPHIEFAVKAQRIMCVKKFLEDYSTQWNQYFLICLEITVINSYSAAIINPLIFQNVSRIFVTSALKPALTYCLAKSLCMTT